MGDGRVALILDALGLAQHARIISEVQEKNCKTAQSTAATADVGDKTQLLLFSLEGREHLALPLDQAARLEEFAESAIERSGSREAVQYRGRIMPLVRLAQHLPGAGANRAEKTGSLQVIVYQRDGRSVGLVVDQIRDIIDEHLDLQAGSASPGVLGSAVVQGKITDLVDISGVLNSAGFRVNAA